jgi:DNA-binding LacI/PurR family transcriptional regulator
MALGVMDVLKHSFGLSIPGDVMLAGFDDIPESRRLPYQLTTVRQPLDKMIAETLALLHLDETAHPIDQGVDRAIPGDLAKHRPLGARIAHPARRTAAKPIDA